MSKLAFIDTETTGLDPDLNPIWEIAIIVDEHEWRWLVEVPTLALVAEGAAPPPQPYVSQWVIDNTGFGDRYDRLEALSPHDAIVQFAELVEGRHLVGAVPSFDEERLRAMYRRHVAPMATRFPWHYHLIDVEAMAVGYLAALGRMPDLPWDSDALTAELGLDSVPADQRHTALGDARWAKAIYEAIAGVS